MEDIDIFANLLHDTDLLWDLRFIILSSLQDPTNGYYNVRGHDDRNIRSGGFSEYVPNSRPVYTPSQLPSPSPVYGQHGTQPRIYEFSQRYSTNTVSRSSYEQQQAGQQQPAQPASIYPTDPVYSSSAYLPATYGRAFTSYVKPASYEKVDAYDQSDQASKVSSSSRFSYASSQVSSQQSDLGRPSQRMQTHVWLDKRWGGKKETREKIIIATLTYLCGWTNMNG